MSGLLTVNESDFESRVLQSSKAVLVDFWAPWCGPCRMVEPIVQDLAVEMASTLSVARVNVDDNPSIAERYGIRGIPTLILFKGGEVKETLVGYRPKAEIARAIEPFTKLG